MRFQPGIILSTILFICCYTLSQATAGPLNATLLQVNDNPFEIINFTSEQQLWFNFSAEANATYIIQADVENPELVVFLFLVSDCQATEASCTELQTSYPFRSDTLTTEIITFHSSVAETLWITILALNNVGIPGNDASSTTRISVSRASAEDEADDIPATAKLIETDNFGELQFGELSFVDRSDFFKFNALENVTYMVELVKTGTNESDTSDVSLQILSDCQASEDSCSTDDLPVKNRNTYDANQKNILSYFTMEQDAVIWIKARVLSSKISTKGSIPYSVEVDTYFEPENETENIVNVTVPFTTSRKLLALLDTEDLYGMDVVEGVTYTVEVEVSGHDVLTAELELNLYSNCSSTGCNEEEVEVMADGMSWTFSYSPESAKRVYAEVKYGTSNRVAVPYTFTVTPVQGEKPEESSAVVSSPVFLHYLLMLTSMLSLGFFY